MSTLYYHLSVFRLDCKDDYQLNVRLCIYNYRLTASAQGSKHFKIFFWLPYEPLETVFDCSGHAIIHFAQHFKIEGLKHYSCIKTLCRSTIYFTLSFGFHNVF